LAFKLSEISAQMIFTNALRGKGQPIKCAAVVQIPEPFGIALLNLPLCGLCPGRGFARFLEVTTLFCGGLPKAAVLIRPVSKGQGCAFDLTHDAFPFGLPIKAKGSMNRSS